MVKNKILDSEIKLLIKKRSEERENTTNILFSILIICIIGFIYSVINNNTYYAITISFLIGLLFGNVVSRNLFVDRISKAISGINSVKNSNNK